MVRGDVSLAIHIILLTDIYYIYIYIFMSSCVGGSKVPPRTISQQDTRCECYINNIITVLYQKPV